MKISKVFARFGANSENEQELRRVARALANELPQQRVDVLRSFRARISELGLNQSTYAGGYVAAMSDVAAETEVVAASDTDLAQSRELASRGDHRALILALLDGPARPHELAVQVDLDMGTVVCVLEELGDVGLVKRYPSGEDWRQRGSTDNASRERMRTQRDVFGSPYRLTVKGDRLARELGDVLPDGFELGVALAVEMLSHLVRDGVMSADTLTATAERVLAERAPTRPALDCFTSHARAAGLLSELASPPSAQPGHQDRALWHSIPTLLSQLQRHKRDDGPLYVRSGYAWDAWESALKQHAVPYPVLSGEVLGSGGTPTGEPFQLLYDHPSTATADLREPAMQHAIRHADAKYVVRSSHDTIPDGFTALELAHSDD